MEQIFGSAAKIANWSKEKQGYQGSKQARPFHTSARLGKRESSPPSHKKSSSSGSHNVHHVWQVTLRSSFRPSGGGSLRGNFDAFHLFRNTLDRSLIQGFLFSLRRFAGTIIAAFMRAIATRFFQVLEYRLTGVTCPSDMGSDGS